MLENLAVMRDSVRFRLSRNGPCYGLTPFWMGSGFRIGTRRGCGRASGGYDPKDPAIFNRRGTEFTESRLPLRPVFNERNVPLRFLRDLLFKN